MKIQNPNVTLADEARIGVKEEVRSGFLDWLFTCNVEGDDGEIYDLSGTVLSMHQEQMDLVTIALAKGKGHVEQLKNSIYKVGKFPGALYNKFLKSPAGTLKIEKNEHSIKVLVPPYYEAECFDNGKWNIKIDSGDGIFKAAYTHQGYGYPLWYGREEPSALTQHSITYGYNWAGNVEGYFIYNGKKVNIKGTGQRERYVAVDSSAAELGGWEDWGYITFDQIHSSMYDMRLGMKDFSIYDLEAKKHYPEGNMEINHEDWIFIRELDGFVPEYYNIKIEVEDGVYEVRAHTCNVRTWGVTFQVPDNPVATLLFDNVEGKFTYKDGRIKELTGGRGVMSIRQWHQYPNILPRELYQDDETRTTDNEKFDTL